MQGAVPRRRNAEPTNGHRIGDDRMAGLSRLVVVGGQVSRLAKSREAPAVPWRRRLPSDDGKPGKRRMRPAVAGNEGSGLIGRDVVPQTAH